MPHKMINLALQGGGAHGALTWGVLDKLLEDNRIGFDCISATSAGAVNAAVLAQGLINDDRDEARELLRVYWKAISDAGTLYSPIKLSLLESMMHVMPNESISFFMFDSITKLLSPYEFNPLDINPLRDIVESLVDFEKIKQLKNPKLLISATNVCTGKIKIFQKEEITLDAIMASACLPFLFKTVHIDNEDYWDGGYMGNPALFPLIYHASAPDILIVHINPIHRDKSPKTASDIMNRINEVSFNSSLMRELRAVAFVTQLLDNGWIKKAHEKKVRRIYLHGIRADKDMEQYHVASKFNTEWPFLLSLFEKGRQLADEWINTHIDSIGIRSSMDLNEYL